MSETPASPQITGKMFLFERPELLNRQQHGDLGLDAAAKPFGFCSKIRAVPLTISEVTEASKFYPVVFMSHEEPIPIAVVGINSDDNLFVDEEGNWEPYAYVPGYLRRYPFALAGESGGGDRYALVVDSAFEGLKKDASRKLFEGGEMSDFVKQAMEFTKTYENDRLLTEQVMKALKKYDLIQPQTAQYTPAGVEDPKPFAQYYGVDEQRMQALKDEQLLELWKMNVLPVLYAHLISLGNWRHLIARRMRRFNMTEIEAITGQRLS